MEEYWLKRQKRKREKKKRKEKKGKRQRQKLLYSKYLKEKDITTVGRGEHSLVLLICCSS